MSEQPDLSTLPKRMRYAARVLEEATERELRENVFEERKWSAERLLDRAGEFNKADYAKRQKLVEELACELWGLPPGAAMGWSKAKESYQEVARSAARKLIESGWRKGDPA
jgi:hypothetical protein